MQTFAYPDDPRPLIGARGSFVSLVLIAGLVGILVVLEPRVAAFLAVLCIGAGILAFRPDMVERWATLALLGGAMVLAYGFANLGFQTSLAPVPLTEILLVPLVLFALADPRHRPPTANMIPLFLFFFLVLARLFFDYWTYRSLAVRDATIAIEAFMLVIGYRALSRESATVWIRRLGVISILILVYASFYPWRQWLSSFAPTVGLQRNVPLLGLFAGIEPAVAAATMFFAIYSKGTRRMVLVTWGLVIIALLQVRGLYVTLIPAVIVMGILLRRSGRVLAVTAAGLAVAIALLSFLATQGIQGRLGPLSHNFYSAQVGTLFGGEGPGAGTITDRVKWAKRTISYVDRSPAYLAVGVGLGPDLAFGFQGPGGISVRKPHDDYLEVFARTGFLGLTFFLWLIAAAFAPIWRRARAGPDADGRFCTWIVASCIVYLGVAATQPTLAFPYGTVPFFFMLGAGLAVARKKLPIVRNAVAIPSNGHGPIQSLAAQPPREAASAT